MTVVVVVVVVSGGDGDGDGGAYASSTERTLLRVREDGQSSQTKSISRIWRSRCGSIACSDRTVRHYARLLHLLSHTFCHSSHMLLHLS